MSGSHGWQRLLPHPDSVAEAKRVAVAARVLPANGHRLRFEYRADSSTTAAESPVQLRLPRDSAFSGTAPAAADRRADELWRETCCEAFLRVGEAPGYLEFNFSPSGRWAAYQFDGYRDGMRELAMRAPRMACRCDPDGSEAGDFTLVAGFELQAELELPGFVTTDWARVASLQLALTVVLLLGPEGRTSHWSLRHPPGRPDFHDPSNFALTLPTPAATSG